MFCNLIIVSLSRLVNNIELTFDILFLKDCKRECGTDTSSPVLIFVLPLVEVKLNQFITYEKSINVTVKRNGSSDPLDLTITPNMSQDGTCRSLHVMRSIDPIHYE